MLWVLHDSGLLAIFMIKLFYFIISNLPVTNDQDTRKLPETVDTVNFAILQCASVTHNRAPSRLIVLRRSFQSGQCGQTGLSRNFCGRPTRYVTARAKDHYVKVKLKPYSAAYMQKTREQQRFTILEEAAVDWHELVVLNKCK